MANCNEFRKWHYDVGKKSVSFDCFFLCLQKSEFAKSSRERRAASMGVGTTDLDMMYRRVGFELEPTLDSRITLCVRPKPPSSSLCTIAKSVRAQKSPRYNRFLVIYDLVITDICCVHLDRWPNFGTKFARYIRLLVITGLVIYDFYCIIIILCLHGAVRVQYMHQVSCFVISFFKFIYRHCFSVRKRTYLSTSGAFSTLFIWQFIVIGCVYVSGMLEWDTKIEYSGWA